MQLCVVQCTGVHIVYVFLCEYMMYPNSDVNVCVCVAVHAAGAGMATVLRFIDILAHYLII